MNDTSANGERTAVIANDPEWDHFRRVERRRWRIDLHGGPLNGRRKFVRTKREAEEWCDEVGYAIARPATRDRADT